MNRNEKAKMKATFELYWDVLDDVVEKRISDQEAIARLVKGGYSRNAESAQRALTEMRHLHFAATHPPGSDIMF